jgi:hypothetical protein
VSMAPPPGGTRLRRPSKKAQKTPGARASVVKAARTKKALSFKPEPEPPPPVPVVDGLVKLELAPDGGVLPDASAAGNTKKVKPKSGTFKVAWSVEEQRLLERLLEEHPDGSKNRSVLASRVAAVPGLTGVADGSRSRGRWVAGVRRARSRAACRSTLRNFGALGWRRRVGVRSRRRTTMTMDELPLEYILIVRSFYGTSTTREHKIKDIGQVCVSRSGRNLQRGLRRPAADLASMTVRVSY